MKSYPSAEKQSVYSTTPADRAVSELRTNRDSVFEKIFFITTLPTQIELEKPFIKKMKEKKKKKKKKKNVFI